MSIERVHLGKELRHQEDPKTGLPMEHEPLVETEVYEDRATGGDVQALLGEMREASQVHLQQAYNREQAFGVAEISDPDGRPVRVLGNEIEAYEKRGFNRAALKATFRINGFGGMKREGLKRVKIRYRNGIREVIREER